MLEVCCSSCQIFLKADNAVLCLTSLMQALRFKRSHALVHSEQASLNSGAAIEHFDIWQVAGVC